MSANPAAPSRLDAVLAELRYGTVAFLGTCPIEPRLTLGSLALQALRHELSGGGRDRLSDVIGVPELSDSITRQLSPTRPHDLAWIAAGNLFEQVLASRQPEVTHVVYLDPWSISADPAVRERWPDAKRWFLDDLASRRALAHAAYWDELNVWIRKQSFSGSLKARDLLAKLPDTFWPAAVPADRWLDDAAGMTGTVVVIDEAADVHRGLESVRTLIDRWSAEARVVLLTPHLDHYQATGKELLDRCALALDTGDLAADVYVGLLAQATHYIAPQGLPFDRRPLGALNASATIQCGESDRGAISGEVPRRSSTTLPSPGEPPVTKPSEVFRQTPTVSSLVLDEGYGGNLSGWWRHLSNLAISSTDAGNEHRPGRATVAPDRDNRQAPAPDRRATPQPSNDQPASFAFLTCCYKYLQRFRIFIDSVVRQEYPLDRIEVCVAAPGNPDGLFEYVEMVRQVHPQLGIHVVELPEVERGNKGRMLNAAFKRSTAQIVMVADCDLVLPPTFVATMTGLHRPDSVLGCWRTPISRELTARILIGDIDPVEEFDTLSKAWDQAETTGGVRQGLLGYCQIVSREVFAAVGYPEEFEGFNQSDIVFIDRLRERAGVGGDFRKDLFVLHLSHLRDWSGTKVYL